MAEKCPDCGAELEHDEVDIGVGIMYGPSYCTECGYDTADEDCDEGKWDDEADE